MIQSRIIINVLTLLTFLLLATPVLAQQKAPSLGGGSGAPSLGGGGGKVVPINKLSSPIQAQNIQDLLLKLVDLAIVLGAIAAAFVFLWIGFSLVMARGDPKAITAAKEYFFAAVVGTAILISSKVIVEVIKSTLVNTGVVNQELFNKKL